MKTKLLFLLTFCFMSVSLAMAQTTVKGNVVQAEDDEPIIGASVIVKGSSSSTLLGATTDIDGNFSITNVPADAKELQVSYIGMTTVTVPISSFVKVRLESESAVLDDVVVVAYGTAKKSSLTGAITSVSSQKIDLRPVSSASQALEGTTSGVIVNSSVGDPSASPTIRIRGIGTVNGNSDPLYIVDGVPFGGNISDINPADIESISVLKDAASCALYGNRASNGVILINTKKGKEGKVSFELRMNVGTYTRGQKEYKRMDAKQWMETQYINIKNGLMAEGKGLSEAEALAEVQNSLISKYLYTNIFDKPEDQLFDANGKITANILSGYQEDLDWFDQATQHGKREEYVFSGNAASEKSNFYFSLGYLNNEGYVKNSGIERITGLLNVSIHPTTWLTTGMNINVSHQKILNTSSSDTGSSNAYSNVFMYARNISPIYPVHLHNEDGSYALDEDGNRQYDNGNGTRNQFIDRHVIWENELNKNKSVRNTVNGTAFADVKFLDDFTFTLKGNLNFRHNSAKEYSNSIIGDGLGAHGRAKKETYYYKNWTFQQQLRWNHEFEGGHTVEALVGHENYSYMYDYEYVFKTGETFFGKDYLSNFAELASIDGYENNYCTESYLGRVRYNYQDRYNVEASFRRDGSSRFYKDSRWGSFGSIGANWVISQEEFMKDYTWINNLKLRGDWGQVGNDAGSGMYAYMALYASENYKDLGAYYLSQNAAKDLKWETGESWGLALEGRYFDRWNLTVEYYKKRNKDLIFDVYQPLSAGATSTSNAESTQTKNLGTIDNFGIEIETDVDVFRNKDWRVNLATNLTTQKNKIVKLPEQNKDGIISGNYKIVEGKSRYEYYTYTWVGVDQLTGNSLYKANTEDYHYVVDGESIGKATGTDITNYVTIIDGKPYVNNTSYALREFHGSALPKVYGSFTTSVEWKGLAVSALFTYSLGGKVMDSLYGGLMTASSKPYALHSDLVNSWISAPEGMTEDSPNRIDSNGLPRIDYSNTYNNTTSSRWLTKRDYFIFKNLNVSYKLPKNWIKVFNLNNVSVNFACENLFIKTARQGLNAQQTISGSQYNVNAPARTYTFGLNIKL